MLPPSVSHSSSDDIIPVTPPPPRSHIGVTRDDSIPTHPTVHSLNPPPSSSSSASSASSLSTGVTSDVANLSPLQKRLNSPERLQLRHRFAAAVAASASGSGSVPVAGPGSSSGSVSVPFPMSGSEGDSSIVATNADDTDSLLAAHLASLTKEKQEKAKRNREDALAARKRQGETTSTRLSDAELRRESRLRSKVEQSDTRLALAAENAEEAVEARRKRAESENQKVKELHFINEQAREERRWAAQVKAESSEARVKALKQQQLEKIVSSNSRTTAVVDERKRAERESDEKKQTEHAQIDARLAEAARRKADKKTRVVTATTGNSTSSTAVGTPNESPFTSPRVVHHTAALIDQAIAAAAATTSSPSVPLPTAAPVVSSLGASTSIVHDVTGELLLEELPELDASFCTLCKVKLNTPEYVRRHVGGKKHQSLLAEEIIKGGHDGTVVENCTNTPGATSSGTTSATHPIDAQSDAISTTATVAGSSSSSSPTVAPHDPYIVSLSSLALLSSTTKTPLRYLTQPMTLTAPSKSSRRNQKKKARRLRLQLTAVGSGASTGGSGGTGNDTNGQDEFALETEDAQHGHEDDSTTERSKAKSKDPTVTEITIEDLAPFPTTRLYTQVVSLIGVLERATNEKASGGSSTGVNSASTKSTVDDTVGTGKSSSALHVLTDDIDLLIQEELQSVLVRLDEEQSLARSDTSVPIASLSSSSASGDDLTPTPTSTPTTSLVAIVLSPPALKVLLVAKLTSHILAGVLSNAAAANQQTLASHLSSDTIKLSAEVVESCCRSSPTVVEMLLHRQKMIPLVDLVGRSLHQLDLHSSAAHVPSQPPAYLEYILRALTIILRENADDENETSVSSVTSDDKIDPWADPSATSTSTHMNAARRERHHQDRQHLVRYICLSGLLARVAQQFLLVDQYLTRVPSASVSAHAAALASSFMTLATPNMNTTPTTAPITNTSTTTATATATGKSLRAKERVATKSAQQKSIGKAASASEKKDSLKAPQLPIHVPTIPHCTFYLQLVDFLYALTTMPSGVSSQSRHTSVYNTALVNVLKATGIFGLLTLVGALTLSHWIIPAQKMSTAQPSTQVSLASASTSSIGASSGTSSSAPTLRDQALATFLTPDAATLIHSAFRVLNNVARYDRALLQDFSERFQPHIFEILSFLLTYTLAHMSKFSSSSSSSAAATSSSPNNIHQSILEEMIAFMGSISLLCTTNQRMMCEWKENQADGILSSDHSDAGNGSTNPTASGVSDSSDDPSSSSSPTLFHQLCHLPSAFFTEARLQNILFPTLLGIAFTPIAPTHTNDVPSGGVGVGVGGSTGDHVTTSLLLSELGKEHASIVIEWMENMSSGATRYLNEQTDVGTTMTGTSDALATNTSQQGGDDSSTPVSSLGLPRSSSTIAINTTKSSPPLSPVVPKSSTTLVKKRSSSSASLSSATAAAVVASWTPSNSPPIELDGKAKRKSSAGNSSTNSTATNTSKVALKKSTIGKHKSLTKAALASMADEKKADDAASSSAPTVPTPAPTPAPAPMPSVSPSPQFSSAPVIFPSHLPPAVRADLARRFPVNFWKLARAQLF